MNNLPEKIHTAIHDLRKLQQEIQSPTDDTEPRLANVDSATLKEFKKSVDSVRQLLWTYIQADSLEHGQNLEEELRSLRLQHVTEMLHSIQLEAKVRQFKRNSATVSFLNACHEIADAAFERHATIDSNVERAG